LKLIHKYKVAKNSNEKINKYQEVHMKYICLKDLGTQKKYLITIALKFLLIAYNNYYAYIVNDIKKRNNLYFLDS
jgi:hypothetical protein